MKRFFRMVLRRPLLLALGGLFVAGLAWAAFHSPQSGGDERSSAQEYEAPPPGMILVPAGEFFMGSNDSEAEPDERPLRRVFLPAFYIDRFEVTNRRYQEVKKDHRFPAGEEELPVTLVLKREAEEYGRLTGKRLPTNAEWEKAARGTDGRTYPWGDSFITASGKHGRPIKPSRLSMPPVTMSGSAARWRRCPRRIGDPQSGGAEVMTSVDKIEAKPEYLLHPFGCKRLEFGDWPNVLEQ